MTVQLIITLCVLLLFAYIFDISAAKTKIPSVVLLLLLGWGVRQGTILLNLQIPSLMPLLPVLGTMGLILIVLEGAMELKLDRSKLPLVGKSFFMAILPIILISGLLGWVFYESDGIISFKDALANAVPFAVISSAIAIPSSRNLGSENREFVTYESSFSDILGVILFNFIVFNQGNRCRICASFLLGIPAYPACYCGGYRRADLPSEQNKAPCEVCPHYSNDHSHLCRDRDLAFARFAVHYPFRTLPEQH